MRISNKRKDNIAKDMFGLFFEDINYAADGGLYAEMIENRSFEAKEAFGIPGKFYTVDDFGYGWSGVSKDEVEPKLQFVSGTPLSEVNPHYLRFTAGIPGQGFKNKAYDGITLKKKMTYKVSFYARCVSYEADGLTVSVEKDGKCFGDVHVTLKKAAPYAPYCDIEPSFVSGWTAVDKVGEYRRSLDLSKYAYEADWVKYEAELVATDMVRGADFIIRLDAEGVIEFDLISMIPADAVAGVFRKDLYEALDGIHPGFIRFPGGCIVEGISLDNRYRWKQTVGELKDRKYIPNLWAFDDSRDEKDINHQRVDAHYGQSYGIGFYEYFLLCELLGAKALPVVGIGAACQFRSEEMVDVNSPEFYEYVQDALDLVEFANGDVNTKWGALRASMGHPESFNLEYLAVGNEQWDTTRLKLFERIDVFEKALHKSYPELKLLGTAGPSLDLPISEGAWKKYREINKENSNSYYAIDEHYYVHPNWMYDRIDLYDSYPREVGVFAGEYAAHPENRGNNMTGALAEAAFLTGIEKNAGVVKLAAYAPLFNRIGHSQWKPDMIWFDDREVYLSPSYQVQKLYANNVGDFTIDMDGQEKSLRANGIYISVTGRNAGEIIVKCANVGDADYELPLTDEADMKITGKATVHTLVETAPEPDNMPQPSEVITGQIELDGKILLRAKTFTVIIIGA